ncbi:ribonuclease domain-containing protein [Streptomyces sp. NPDC005474]|uniref:ribonuclease domain-containing protein n=1 Tax=Streptomyces sp. NPDC005474 TaxID=3154878 RepID=UPI003456A025
MTSERTTAAEPVDGQRHKRRSRWLSGKFLVLFLAIATVLGGVTLLTTESQQKASAAVDDGNGFSFPDHLDNMVAFWDTKAWPLNKATSSEQGNNASGQPGATSFIYRGGSYGDRDGQLTAFIRANFPNAVPSIFNEYDIDFRATRRTPRNANRIVRDRTNGFIFFTDDHYANFHLYAYQNLPDVDDAQPSLPSSSFTVQNSLTPVAEETAGDPPAGGSSGAEPDPNVITPIEDPDFEVQNNDRLGQADETGDLIYTQLTAFLLGALILAGKAV